MRFLVGFMLVLLTTTTNVALAAEDKALSLTEYVKNLESKQGFYTFYYRPADGKLYLLVNKSQLGDEFLFQSSLPYGMGSNDIGLDRGQLGETRLVKFERFGKRVLLKQLNTGYRASTNNPAEKQAINEAFASSVIAGLEVVSESDEQLLVDYTDFLLSDIHRIGETLKSQKQGSYKIDATRSGVHAANSKSFPDNTELESLVTFVGTDAGNFVKQVTPSYESITVHLHHSLIRLPDNNYKTRAFHPMSGYWSISHKDYGTAIDEQLVQRVIPRHRLEKKNPDAKISEAVEPIVYYLDPGVPEPIRSALKDGAMWWDQAFTAIGYKNAFQVKDLPQGADPMDVRYNTIQWVHRATRGWSYGYSVIDPRTGEILKGHVTLGSLRVRQDLLIALGLTSPYNDKQNNKKQANITPQKEMALARIRQLAAHEVGHTLGIAHNFSASENGRASVMDYPHPLLTLKRGKVDLSNAYDTDIGEWDKHVIAYGYQNYTNAEQEQTGLMQTIQDAQKQGLDFLSDPDARGIASANPQGHLWDNGTNPVNELKNVMAVRKTALEHFGLNSIAQGSPLSQLEENLVPIYLLHRFQLEAVARQIGGMAYRYETKEAGKKPQGISPVSAKHQEQALKSLLTALDVENLELSDELLRLITPQAYGYERTREAFKGQTGQVFDSLSAAESLSAHIVKMILHPARLNRLNLQKQSSFNISTLVDELLKATISSNKPESAIQNRVNHVVVNSLVELLEKPELGLESKAIIHDALVSLVKNADKEKTSKAQTLIYIWLEHYLNEGEWKGKLKTAPLPPGSPI